MRLGIYSWVSSSHKCSPLKPVELPGYCTSAYKVKCTPVSEGDEDLDTDQAPIHKNAKI